MEQIDSAKELEKAKLISEFYYSLARLQTRAINYVAYGETEDEKIERVKSVIEQVQETIKLVGETGLEIPRKDCDPPCHWDDMVGMCICT